VFRTISVSCILLRDDYHIFVNRDSVNLHGIVSKRFYIELECEFFLPQNTEFVPEVAVRVWRI